MPDFRKILVRAPNWVGDVVMATPALRAIREAFPNARITVVARPSGCAILAGAPWFDALLSYDDRGRDRGWIGFLGLGWLCRREGYDLGILLTNSFGSALQLLVAGPRRRLGYDLEGRGLFLTDKLRPPMRGHKRVPAPMPRYYLDLLQAFGVPRRGEHLELFVTEADAEEGERFLAERGVEPDDVLVALNPGASYGPSKLWREDRFAEVGEALAERHGAKVLVLCGPGEEGIARGIESRLGGRAIPTSVRPLGLGALKAVMRRVDLLVTTDTGPRHFAVAFGKPVVCVMGPTDPLYTACNLERTIVVREPVECSPCMLKVCPIDHRCMERIDSARVVVAAEELLSRFVLAGR
jgi:heptosyltransferase-2